MAKAKKERSDDRKGVQSVEVAARILVAIGDANGPCKLKDIAASIDISPSRTHGYLVSLLRADLIHQDTMGRYDLGEKARRLGLAALARMDVMPVVDALIHRLLENTEQTIAACVWTEHGPCVVRWMKGRDPLAININLGSILPLMGTAVGRIFLAFLPKQVTRSFLEAEFKAMSRRRASDAISTRAELEPILEDIRRLNYAYIEGTLVPDVGAMAAAVFDSQGQVAASVGLLGRDVTAVGGARESMVRELQNAVNWASEQLGHRKSAL